MWCKVLAETVVPQELAVVSSWWGQWLRGSSV